MSVARRILMTAVIACSLNAAEVVVAEPSAVKSILAGVGATLATDSASGHARYRRLLGAQVSLTPLMVSIISIQRVIAASEAIYARCGWCDQPRRKLELWWNLRKARKTLEELQQRLYELHVKFGLSP